MKKVFLALILILSILLQPILAYAYTINYTYDSLNRLISVNYGNGQTINYSYDAGGNLTGASNATANQLQVVSTDPADGATNVPVDQAVYAVFNNCIQPGPNIADISIENSDSTASYANKNDSVASFTYSNNVASNTYNSSSAVPCTCSIDNDTLCIVPTGNLDTSVAYSVYIPSGAVQDYYGNTLSTTYSFSFTTQATSAFPVVTGSSPANNAVNVSVYQSVYFTFNESIQPGGNFSGVALEAAGGTVVDTVYSIVYNSLTITPEEPLAYGVAYSVYLPAGSIEDLSGDSLANPFTISFHSEHHFGADHLDLEWQP